MFGWGTVRFFFLIFLLQLEEVCKSNSCCCDLLVLAKPLGLQRAWIFFLVETLVENSCTCVAAIMWSPTFVLITNLATKIIVLCLFNH